MDWGQLVGLGIQAGSSMIGQAQGGAMREEAAGRLQAILDQYGHLPLPELEAIIAEQLGPSAAGAVTADPASKAAQLEVMTRLAQMQDGGLTMGDRSALADVQNSLARNESAGRASIEQGMRNRGTFDSGAQLAMMLQNQQGQASRANEVGMNIAAQAQQRALEAMMKRGQMAGQMRDPDFGERFKAATARDEINRFNAASRNQAKYHNANLPQQQWENKFRTIGGQAGMSESLAGMGERNAQRTEQMYAGLGVAGREAFKDDDEYVMQHDPVTNTYKKVKVSS